MNFSWKLQAPEKGWWANYRWHITEQSEKLGLKSSGWKKSFFRQGWQSKILALEGVDNAKKCLQALQNGTITAFGGRFRGASYDKNAERMIKQVKKSLKEAIKNYYKGENINTNEVVAVPDSYYRWGIIIGAVGVVLVIGIGLIIFLVINLKKKGKKVKNCS